MITRSIQNLSLFKIIDEITENTCYGCDQEWYKTNWQRRSGCGPTVVSNIVFYLSKTRAGARADNSKFTKSDLLKLMEEIWNYVTPTLRGIPSTKLLYDDVLAYAKSKALNMKLDLIDIPSKRHTRPEFAHLLSFLDEALRSDQPVAFLNLNNGAEKQLYSWHWVTIVSLEYSEDGATAFTDILDEGVIKRIDLAKWFKTTTLGGGFVSINQL